MKLCIAAVIFFLLACSTAALAQSRSPYAPRQQGASQYNAYGDQTHGFNYGTGSRWSTRYDQGGMSGYDKHGHAWRYDRDTKTYYNYGTGERRSRGKKY